MAAHFASPKRYVRGVAEQVQEEAELASLRLKTTDDFWALRAMAGKKASWRPLVKLIHRRWEWRCARQDRIDFLEGQAKRRGAKRRRPLRGQLLERKLKRVRWDGEGGC
jgi:hypothetical protein